MKQKKPKPWYRLRNIVLVIVFAIVAFIGWAFLEVWEVYTAEPNPTIDYRAKLREMAEKNANVSSEEADASWQLIVDAMDLFVEAERQVNEQLSQFDFKSRSKSDEGDVDFDYPLYGTSLPDNVDREKQCLQKMRELGVPQLLDELSTSSNIGLRPVTGSGSLINDLLPYAAWARGFAKSQASLIRIYIADGDSKQVVTSLKHTLSLAEIVSYQPTIVEYMVATSMAMLVIDEAQFLLTQSDLDAETYSALAKVLGEFSLSPAVYSLECERAHYHELADWVFTDESDGDGYMTSTLSDWGFIFYHKEKSIADAIQARFYLATKQETLAEFDDLIDWLIAESKVPSRKESLSDGLTKRMMEINRSGRFPFVPNVLGALDSVFKLEGVLNLEVSATQVMIAIAQYKSQQGNYPVRLDELIPEFLTELPIDPINGGALGYKLITNDPHGRPYLIYSTGLNQKDDGGDFNTEDSLLCIDDPNAQTDYTANQPHRPMKEYLDQHR